jgi:hypothetical protein
MCIGQEEIYVAKYDPVNRRYLKHDLDEALHARVVRDSLTLVRALGYDMNTVEWAVRDGEPYAIDFMNPAPDMDINSCGYEYHRWCVERMADMCIRYAQQPAPQPAPYRL